MSDPRQAEPIPGPLPPAAEMGTHAAAAADLLKTLASPHRLLVLCVLGEGELSVGALNERIGLSQSALSQHLAVLRAEGLVRTRRQAQSIFYRVTPGPALDVIRALHAHFCGVTPPPGAGNTGKQRRPVR